MATRGMCYTRISATNLVSEDHYQYASCVRYGRRLSVTSRVFLNGPLWDAATPSGPCWR
jgi:hypothetical protein